MLDRKDGQQEGVISVLPFGQDEHGTSVLVCY